MKVRGTPWILAWVVTLGISSQLVLPGAPSARADETAPVGSPLPDLDKLNPLLSVSNDQNPAVNSLSLVLASAGGPVTGVDMITNWHDHGGDHDTITHQSFSLSQIGSGYGAVIYQQQGYDVLFLRGHLDEASGRGTYVARFLTNALTGQYGECGGNLIRGSTGAWEAMSAAGRPVRSARVITWSFGVTTIQGVC